MRNALWQRRNFITSVRHKEMRSAGVTSTKWKVQPVGFGGEAVDCSPPILLLASYRGGWTKAVFISARFGWFGFIPTWMSFHTSSCLFPLFNFQPYHHTTIPPAFLLSYVNCSGDRSITCFLHWLPWAWQVFLLLDRNLESWKNDPFFIIIYYYISEQSNTVI